MRLYCFVLFSFFFLFITSCTASCLNFFSFSCSFLSFCLFVCVRARACVSARACVCACACVCMRACVCACVRVCVTPNSSDMPCVFSSIIRHDRRRHDAKRTPYSCFTLIKMHTDWKAVLSGTWSDSWKPFTSTSQNTKEHNHTDRQRVRAIPLTEGNNSTNSITTGS